MEGAFHPSLSDHLVASLPAWVLAGLVLFLVLGLGRISLGQLVGSESRVSPTAARHWLRGKVINLDGQPLSRIRVQLAHGDGTPIGSQSPGYDGNFVFEQLAPGSYLLTIEREHGAAIGRTVEIRAYPTPKTIFLEIKLDAESSASIREIVTDFTLRDSIKRAERPTRVSKKALKAFQLAVAASERGDRLKAIDYLEQALREQPDYFEACNNLGVQHLKLGQWPQAIQAFQRAIELRPDSVKPYLNLGTVYWRLGQLEPAIESFESANRIEPNSVIIHSSLGQLFFQKQNYLKAQEHLETATRLNPKEARSAFLLLIQLANSHQDFGRARQYLEVMLQYFPADPEALKFQEVLSKRVRP